MSATSLEVLIVEGEEPITAALAAALGRRGHRVVTARDVETALSHPTPDVLVCEDRLSGGGGLDLLAALSQRGERSRSVLLLSDPTVDDCLRAVRLGATALLAKPFRLADLVRAVESGTGRTDRAEEGSTFEASCATDAAAIEGAASDLAAFCVRQRVPASVRARIVGAACEILENAARHAELGLDGRVRARGRLRDRWLSLAIEDRGAGFDPRSSATHAAPGPALRGLDRARALADGFRLDAAPGVGTRVELRFCVAHSSFAEDEVDLSEVDYLPPATARGILATLLEGETPDVVGISPAIAVVLGRLLAGPDPAAAAPAPAPRGARPTRK